MDVGAVQTALRDQGLDGWLLYDFQGTNPIAQRLAGLGGGGHMASRRWFYMIPASGEPRGLVHKIESHNLDRVPGPVLQPAPLYPGSMRREGIGGTVRVEFVVDVDGRVANTQVVETTHTAFNDAAVSAVSKWKFRPGMKNGRKVNTRMCVPIVFTLAEQID